MFELTSLRWGDLYRVQPSKPMQVKRKTGASININSGGAVFFLLFRNGGLTIEEADEVGASGVDTPATPATPQSPTRMAMDGRIDERACVLKVCDGTVSTHSHHGFQKQSFWNLNLQEQQGFLQRESLPMAVQVQNDFPWGLAN